MFSESDFEDSVYICDGTAYRSTREG